MQHLKLYQKGKIVFLFFAVTAILTAACGRLAYLMIVQSDYYGKKAQALHERERSIKAARGKLLSMHVFSYCPEGSPSADCGASVGTSLSMDSGVCST